MIHTEIMNALNSERALYKWADAQIQEEKARNLRALEYSRKCKKNKIKSFFIRLFISILLILAVSVEGYIKADAAEISHNYATCGVVVEITTKKNIIDEYKNIWRCR